MTKATGPVHKHSCPTCGERWLCAKDCLKQCGCIGRPRCTHFYCVKCQPFAPVDCFRVGRTSYG
jgi:hypothetical protein